MSNLNNNYKVAALSSASARNWIIFAPLALRGGRRAGRGGVKAY